MIIPVLLCGGHGTRLWPLSRKSYPKQFGKLLDDESLFQSAVRRFRADGFADPLVVTSDDFRFIVSEQLEALGVQPQGILIEPDGRNTAPAAIAAALHVAERDPQARLLLVPSDHAAADPEAFRCAVRTGCAAADAGRIVTFGVAPTRPETGYGWLESGEQVQEGVCHLNRFIEKPDAETAATLFADDRFLWNTGVFLASAETLIAAFQEHAAETHDRVAAALNASIPDLGFTRLDPEAWEAVPSGSIDYAVMEKAANMSVVRFDGHWSDLGSWEAVWQESERDGDGNAFSGPATALGCTNSLLRSENADIRIVGLGLSNVVAVAMRDAVLVAHLSESQQVGQAVAALARNDAKQAHEAPVDHRPWGWFETLVLGDRFQVKRILVRPGAALSLQSHVHRSEHWIVVQGTARVTLNDEVLLRTENQSIYIPVGARHRLENPGKIALVLIEVQTGAYLGEDDITRYADNYTRT